MHNQLQLSSVSKQQIYRKRRKKRNTRSRLGSIARRERGRRRGRASIITRREILGLRGRRERARHGRGRVGARVWP